MDCYPPGEGVVYRFLGPDVALDTMPVYTDSPEFAGDFFSQEVVWARESSHSVDSGLRPLFERIFGGSGHILSVADKDLPLPYLLLTEHSEESQYDQLIELARKGVVPRDGVACLAGSGTGFHGFKGRSWAALPGNLHLVVYLEPGQPIHRFEVAFTALAALSVVESLDRVPGLQGEAGIKWVNDILVAEAKIGGVLSYTQSQGGTVTSAIIGIGLNVEATPDVEPTPFVPRVASVRDFLAPQVGEIRGEVFWNLLRALARNYAALLVEGADPLLGRYRARSLVIGRGVSVCSESSDQVAEVVAEGRVVDLGENLELIIEGQPKPITSGRLVLGSTGEEIEPSVASTEKKDSMTIAKRTFGT